MKPFSLDPDPWNEWIYDPSHPDYNSAKGAFMRSARARAMNSAPTWMLVDALTNDSEKDSKGGNHEHVRNMLV